ncbi:MAG: MBL fold metallo-hydrolase, partial [Rhodobacteraceae bacterium]|nr:MBL fold metallo-hydrolase [Paracoccaceae bacterium]
MKITWLGHAGYRIEVEQAVLLLDPWIIDAPFFPALRVDEALAGATHVLLTHGHGDHSASVAAICKKLGVPVVGIYDLVGYLGKTHGIDIVGFNRGGTVNLSGASVT